MAVYIVAQLRFRDRAAYERYQAAFMGIFRGFKGTLLAADEHPGLLEGEWSGEKVVIISFPDEPSAREFIESPEYQRIAVDRKRGAEALVLLVAGVPDRGKDVPLVRIFKARARPGRERELADKLSTTSAALVRDNAGLVTYLAGGPSQAGDRDFVFITIWRDFNAMKEFFGAEWPRSLLPPGYAALIEHCSVEHYELTGQLYPVA